MALAVIKKITRECHNIEQALDQRICGETECRYIDNCDRNLKRIQHLLSPDANNELKRSLAELRTLIDANFQSEEGRRSSVRHINSGESVYHCIHILLSYRLAYITASVQ